MEVKKLEGEEEVPLPPVVEVRIGDRAAYLDLPNLNQRQRNQERRKCHCHQWRRSELEAGQHILIFQI